MSACCSVSISIPLLSILLFVAQISASVSGSTEDQNGSIPFTDIPELMPNSSLNDTYEYFCNGATEIFNGFVQCNPKMQKVVVPPLYCLTYNEEMSMFLAGSCLFLPNTKKD